MRKINKPLDNSNLYRLFISLPFVIAILVIIFIGWTVIEVMGYPYDGILYIHPTGLINVIDTNGPSYEKLVPGDTIISVDGIPWKNFSGYNGKRNGSQVVFTVNRQGTTQDIRVTLVKQSSVEIFRHLGPILIALFFWGTGFAVQTLRTREGSTTLFFAWCQASAVTLAAGTASFLGPAWISKLFGCMLWIIGPLSSHFHTQFPQTKKSLPIKILLLTLYSLALIGILPYLLLNSADHRALSWYPLHISFGRMFLGLNLILVVVLLVVNYLRPEAPGTRSKIRIVAFGGLLSAAPFVFLTVIPDALFQNPIITYNTAFIWLSILPLTYGYAIFRYHLIEIESHVNRGAAFILVYSILGGFYFTVYMALDRFLPKEFVSDPIINTIIVLILGSIFFPVSRQIKQFVDRVFYGGWYDYRSGLFNITQGLEEIFDLDELAKTVSTRLVGTFRLEEACVFFRGSDGKFSVISASTGEHPNSLSQYTYPVLPRTSLTYLLKIGVIEREKLKDMLNQVLLTPEELKLLNSEQINLWVPVIGRGEIHGLLALGPKIGGDMFSSEDLDILRSVVLQLSPLIENLQLLTNLKLHAEELEIRVKNRTAELFDEKERIEAILANVGDGVIVIDLDGIIQRVNPAFEQQSGFKPSEVVGKNLEEIFGLENNRINFDELKKTLIDGQIWNGELANRRKDGKLYDVHLTLAPVRDQFGNLVSYVGSQRDITQWKDLDRLKDAFIQDVSHELRTPATNIKLYLELLSDAPAQNRKRFEKVVNEQSQLLINLVEDILDLSRLASEKYEIINKTEIDLNVLGEQAITAHIPQATSKGIELIFEPAQSLPSIQGDQMKIARMINNLVSNAVRYTRNGTVIVRTYTLGNFVYLQVQDTGIGIEPNDLPHIFDRFYRGANVRQSNIHGTGLGLAIVKEIINLHSGEIEVQSDVGNGSTFTFRIPKIF